MPLEDRIFRAEATVDEVGDDFTEVVTTSEAISVREEVTLYAELDL